MDDLLQKLSYLNGKRFCVVRMRVLDPVKQKVKLTPLHGIARVLPDRLVLEQAYGEKFVVPDSALPSILPNDGTPLLKGAAYYVIVKLQL